jgi:hypothetical protein
VQRRVAFSRWARIIAQGIQRSATLAGSTSPPGISSEGVPLRALAQVNQNSVPAAAGVGATEFCREAGRQTTAAPRTAIAPPLRGAISAPSRLPRPVAPPLATRRRAVLNSPLTDYGLAGWLSAWAG